MSTEIFPFAAVIPEGKTRELEQMMDEIRSNRWDTYQASQRAVGVTKVKAWIAALPEGDLMVGFFESDNEHAMGELFVSEEPFDVWFRARMDAIFPRDAFPPGYEFKVKKIFEWSDQDSRS